MIEHRKFLVLASQGNDRRNPDAYRKSPGGDGKARRTKIVSISCFQDIYSRNSNDERTVGLPVNPSEFRALECRRAPSDFAGRGKHSKATRMKNGLTVRILRTRPSEPTLTFFAPPQKRLSRRLATSLTYTHRRRRHAPYGVARCGAMTTMPTHFPPPRRKSSIHTKPLVHESIWIALRLSKQRQSRRTRQPVQQIGRNPTG